MRGVLISITLTICLEKYEVKDDCYNTQEQAEGVVADITSLCQAQEL